jgi:hypothetical protein
MTFTEQYRTSARIRPDGPDYFRLIPQDGVVHTLVDRMPRHNAIWDMNVRRSDGRVFFSVCGEGMTPEYAYLYEYHRGGTYTQHFGLEKETIQQDRRIRASKFHTSIHFLNDGRLILQTHTTSPSPRHPAWMPESYLNHQWEAFEGSTVLLYHPGTKLAQSKGVLAPYSTLYGGGYSAKANLFFGFGTFDGYGWIYDLDTGEASCIGQVTDGRSNRLYEGPDGHLYYGTASGDLARLNVETRKVEFLARTREHSPLRHGVWDGGTFWFSARSGKSLYKYELPDGTLTEMGRFFEDDDLPGGSRHCYGLDFDSKGVLWFCSNQSVVNGFQGFEAGVKLYQWDVRNGKPKIEFGFLGSPLRTVGVCAQLCIHDDILYVTDGNHFDDPVGIIEVDLRQMTEEKITNSRPLSNDDILYMGVEGGRELYPAGAEAFDRVVKRRLAFLDDSYKRSQFLKINRPHASFAPVEGYVEAAALKVAPHSVAAAAAGATGVALWEYVGYGNGAVQELTWVDHQTITGLCGNTFRFTMKINNGQLSLVEAKRVNETPRSPLTASLPEDAEWPCMPGRQYLAIPESSVRRADGSILVGTKDMMLCLFRDGMAYGLGAVTTSGGVHCLSLAPDGMTVYGVAGYELGKGDFFRYDDANGLRWLGSVPIVKTPTGRQLVNFQPWRVSISPDGKHIAIGMKDEMSGVAVFGLPT